MPDFLRRASIGLPLAVFTLFALRAAAQSAVVPNTSSEGTADRASLLRAASPSRSESPSASTALYFQVSALPTSGEIVREIDDAANGDRWLLLAGESGSGGPGRLVRSASVKRSLGSGARLAAAAVTPAVRADDEVKRSQSEAASVVIRAGDRVVVEEHTSVVDARLSAVAMGPAALGASFHVRLSIGGKLLPAVASGPGTATLLPQPARLEAGDGRRR